MAVGVESDGDVSVAQKFLNELGVLAAQEQERSARVPQVVKAIVSGQPNRFRSRANERLRRRLEGLMVPSVSLAKTRPPGR